MTDASRGRARIEPWVRREVEASDLGEVRSRAGSGWLIWRLRCRTVYGCVRRTSSLADATVLSR